MDIEVLVQGGGVGISIFALSIIGYLVKMVTNHMAHTADTIGKHMEEISKNTLKTLIIVERMDKNV